MTGSEVSHSRQEVERLRYSVDISPQPPPQEKAATPSRDQSLFQTPTPSGSPTGTRTSRPKASCLLKAAHYVVMGSIGLDPSILTPMRMVMDTGSGPSVIHERSLPQNWEQFQVPTGKVPQLADANGNPLRIKGKIILSLQLGHKSFEEEFFVAPKLAVPLILGTGAMNTHVDAIRCRAQRIDIHDGGSIAILVMSPTRKTSPTLSCYVDASRPSNGINLDRQPHGIRLSQSVNVPPRSQVTTTVVCAGGGLSILSPRDRILHRHRVSIPNGVAEVIPRQEFLTILTNFGTSDKYLPKGTIIGYAHRAPERPMRPMALRRPTSSQQAFPVATTLPQGTEADATRPLSWKQEVSLDHLGQAPLRESILEMLSHHESMWDGSLGDIRATEHRIDIMEGSKPRRQQPYRMGPARREIARKEITSMLEKGVIEPSTSEWASPVVLVPKKDGKLRFCVDYGPERHHCQ